MTNPEYRLKILRNNLNNAKRRFSFLNNRKIAGKTYDSAKLANAAYAVEVFEKKIKEMSND